MSATGIRCTGRPAATRTASPRCSCMAGLARAAVLARDGSSQRYPERVSEIVLSSVCTARRAEIDWLYREAGRFFPEQWERFAAGAGRDGDILAAYARLTGDPDLAVREKATDEWCAWEDAMLSPERNGRTPVFGSVPTEARLALVRICAHYFSHGAWLEDGMLLREAHRLAGIPGVLTHGRLDMSGPPDTAWLLARAWPGAELTIIEDAGHLGNEAETSVILSALNRFAGRSR